MEQSSVSDGSKVLLGGWGHSHLDPGIYAYDFWWETGLRAGAIFWRPKSEIEKIYSAGKTFSPPTLMISDCLPKILINSPFLMTLSPVLNQPSSLNGLGRFRYPIMADSALIQRTSSTILVSNPSPPTLSQRDSDDFDFDRRIPTSERPYVCCSRTTGNA